jgi:multicomponent Na+:H+ antiporter subunit F
MQTYFTWLALALTCVMLAGLLRVILGPKAADRMLGTQLFGTTGVAVLLLLSAASGSEALRDVALVFVVLTLLTLIAFVERTPH